MPALLKVALLLAVCGLASAGYTTETSVPSWADRNQDGYTYLPTSTMKSYIGTPCTIVQGQWCSPVTNTKLKGLLIKMNVGPFCITGMSPVLQRLRAAFESVKKSNRDLWSKIGTAGMICCRYIGGTTSFSNHAWGGAIDLKIDGKLDPYNNGKVFQGLIELYPHLHQQGFYWGAAFSREDGMHFEMSKQEMDKMYSSGLLNGRPYFPIDNPSPIANCKYPVMKTQPSGSAATPEAYAMQSMLKYHCFSITVDGKHGPGTDSIIKDFQKSRGISVDGVVGAQSWSRLFVEMIYGDSGYHVTAVCHLLKEKYGRSVSCSSKTTFGTTLRNEVRAFQSAKDLPVTGIVDLKTWQSLLGGCDAVSAPQAASTPAPSAAPSDEPVATATPVASSTPTPTPNSSGECPACPTCPEAPVASTKSSDDTLLSAQQLKCVMPGISESRISRYIGPLNIALYEGRINSPLRIAAFLAQIAHESGELRWWSELGSCDYLEGRKDLGNTQSGDGCRFKGRGPLQLTGRANYAAAGKSLNADLIGDPEQVALPEMGFRTAVWFWTRRNLNSYADQGNFDAITYRVNGGYNGKASRERYYTRGLGCLGGTQQTTPQRWTTLKSGATGYEVAALQYWLVEHSAGSCEPDGSFGSCTDQMVRTYQKAKGLTVDGVVGPMTWEKVVATVRRGSPYKLGVKALQFLLKEKYRYTIIVDGAFGPGTEGVVKKYQESSRLLSDGVVGANTWSYLISGSGSAAAAYATSDTDNKVYVTEEPLTVINVNPVSNATSAAVNGVDTVDEFHPELKDDDKGSSLSQTTWIIIVASAGVATLLAGIALGFVVGKKKSAPKPPARGAVQLNEVRA